MISISNRIAAARGLPSDGNLLSSEEGLELLAKAEMERGSRWESVLLLGSSATIRAGREWHQCAWTLEWFARGKLDGWERIKMRTREQIALARTLCAGAKRFRCRWRVS